MAAVTSFLVLAIVAVNAVRSEVCGIVQIGQLSGTEVPLSKTMLTPTLPDWEVGIPQVHQCPHGAAGVSAIVCDFDVLPTAQFLSKQLLLIQRVGSLQGYGSVTPTVYCGNPWQLNQRWSSNNPALSTLPKLNVQNDAQKWDKTPLKLWDQKPEALVARPH